ncbi:MAG: hypothetical protein QM697_18995 [Lachnospiraceae bacterium]
MNFCEMQGFLTKSIDITIDILTLLTDYGRIEELFAQGEASAVYIGQTVESMQKYLAQFRNHLAALLVYEGYCTQYISLCMEKVLEEDEGLKRIMEQVINFNVTGE